MEKELAKLHEEQACEITDADVSEFLGIALHRLDLLLEKYARTLGTPKVGSDGRMYRNKFSLLYETTENFSEDESQSVEKQLEDNARELHRFQENSEGLRNSGNLIRLAKIFQLDSVETDILLVCLAPEIDPVYEHLYAYLNGEAGVAAPSAGFILKILANSPDEEIRMRTYFDSDSRLLKYGLVFWVDEAEKDSLVNKKIRIDGRTAEFILGINRLSPRLQKFVEFIEPVLSGLTGREDDRHSNIIQSYLDDTNSFRGKLLFCISGGDDRSRGHIIRQYANRLGISYVRVHGSVLLQEKMHIHRVAREAIFLSAALYIDHCEVFTNDADTKQQTWEDMFAVLETMGWLVMMGGDSLPTIPLSFLENNTVIEKRCEQLSFSEQKAYWRQYADSNNIELPPDVCYTLAETFTLNEEQIAHACSVARYKAVSHGTPLGAVTREEIYVACREISGVCLNEFAQKIVPRFGWEMLILAQDKKKQLQEIPMWFHNRRKVFDEWGFGNRIESSHGMNILFFGPSGTGKTMAAGILANELGLEIYRIDLSAVVSKYIGETEKNLTKIFAEAESTNCILFFDEADSLFGKRTDIKDSHDRYANIEINYLLMKMESHSGIVILATNMQKNLDEAIQRRMQFAIEFPFPDEEHRMKLWSSMFPAQTPMNKDVDMLFLAKHFKLSGGNIKNAALLSAFLAAHNHSPVSMHHIIQAVKREYQKLGRACVKSEFDRYYHLVAD